METKKNDIIIKVQQENQESNKKAIFDTKVSTSKLLQDNIENVIFIFCNPKSGNQEGKIFLNIASKYVTADNYNLIDFKEINTSYKPIKAIFFELIKKEEYQKGRKLLIECVNKYKTNENTNKKFKILLAGGDGSVLSSIQDFDKNGLDLNYCLFGHIPLGTGNDLSNSLGFSDHVDIEKDNIDDLYKILLKYHNAIAGKIDIWKLELFLDPKNGQIIENTTGGKIILLDENKNPLHIYRRTFINYFSLGYDARVGYNFDHNRTKSRNCNKCIYFWEGIKKNFFRSTVSVPGFLDSFIVYEDLNNSINDEIFFDKNIGINETTTDDPKETKVLFKIIKENTLKPEEKKKEHIVLKGKPCSIVCQNICMYMSGVKDIWDHGKRKKSLQVVNQRKEEAKKYYDKLNKMFDEPQRPDDKKLEFFTFDNGLETGFEKVVGGLAKKLYHGRGPFEIKFSDTPPYDKEDRKHRVYLNIDGEYFHIVLPKFLKIQLDKSLCQGQIPFLHSVQ